ncbi:MAG: hypothetical protein ABJB17_06245, partial [Burkholderiales bacterium]
MEAGIVLAGLAASATRRLAVLSTAFPLLAVTARLFEALLATIEALLLDGLPFNLIRQIVAIGTGVHLARLLPAFQMSIPRMVAPIAGRRHRVGNLAVVPLVPACTPTRPLASPMFAPVRGG